MKKKNMQVCCAFFCMAVITSQSYFVDASVFENLLINVEAHSCQDLFDYFTSASLCDQVGYDKPRLGTNLCTNEFPGCAIDGATFCSLEDCCQPSEPAVTGTCGDFFTAKGVDICTDAGFVTTQPDDVDCNGDCTLSTCCSIQAPNCLSLYNIIENNDAGADVTTIVGEYSCNTGIWQSPIADFSTFNSPTVSDDYLRSDCCDVRNTCGVLYDSLDGSETCENRGYGTTKDSNHQCDPTTNAACTVTDCCTEEISCKAYNFVANDYSISGNKQLDQCQENGYAYKTPLELSPCYNGKCKHKNCCIRQINCAAYSADFSRTCQNLGYPFLNSKATECFRGQCSAYQCCLRECAGGFGYNNLDRVCYTYAREFGNGLTNTGKTWSFNGGGPINLYDYPNFQDEEGKKTEEISSLLELEAFFGDYDITDSSPGENDVYIIYADSTDNTIYFALGFRNSGTYYQTEFIFYLSNPDEFISSTSFDGTSETYALLTSTTDAGLAGVSLDDYYVN